MLIQFFFCLAGWLLTVDRWCSVVVWLFVCCYLAGWSLIVGGFMLFVCCWMFCLPSCCVFDLLVVVSLLFG